MSFKKSAFSLVLSLCLSIGSVIAQEEEDDEEEEKPHVQASLVTEAKAIVPGKPLWVAARLIMEEDWHTYSDPPGDSGLPTKIIWDLPDGFSAGDIVWPKPKKTTQNDITNFIYEDQVDLKVKIKTPKKIKSKEVLLRAKIKWLECKDVCISDSANVKINVRVQLKKF